MNWVRETFDYHDGCLYWKKRPANRVPADLKRPAGYYSKRYKCTTIRFKGKKYQRARLVWYYHYGKFPRYVGHKNREFSDDRIENLADHVCQKRNTTGFKYIQKKKTTNARQGFIYVFKYYDIKTKKTHTIKQSVDLKKIVISRNKWMSEKQKNKEAQNESSGNSAGQKQSRDNSPR